MARGAWTLYYQNTDLTWELDGTIYPPNEDFEVPINSTFNKMSTVDGGEVAIYPSIKYNFGSPAFKWLFVDSTFVAKIINAAKSGKKFKIITTDPVWGDLIGYFLNPLALQQPGIMGANNAPTYNLSVLFSIVGE